MSSAQRNATLIESLTGIKFEKLLEQVPGLKKTMEPSGPEGKK